MQTRAIQGPVPRRGIRIRKRIINCHRAPGVSKGMSWDGASWADRDARGQDVPLHPMGAARVADKPLPGLPYGFLGEILAFQAAVAGLCPDEAPTSHKPASSRSSTGAFPKPFSLSPHFQGKGLDGRTGSKASPPAPGRCCACSRGRSAKGNTNILPKESTFHQQHRFPFFAQGWPVLGSFPHRTAGLSKSPAELSGLGFGQSRPSPPTVDPPKPVNVTTSKVWRGFNLA